ncbi:MAG TPA: hypothetical protein VL625_07040 [Patescibacteria group bacterium]|nr:hypothetical protein [Patescibacteria group bacterium]
MEPATIAAVAGAVKPEMLNAAGGVLEKTGKGIGHVFKSLGSFGTEHHEIAENARTKRMEILSRMSPEQMEVYLRHEHERAAKGRKNWLTKIALSTSPFGMLALATDLRSPALV